MHRHLMKSKRTRRPAIKVYGMTLEQRAFIREFQAKLASMQVIENFYVDNVIPFPKRGG